MHLSLSVKSVFLVLVLLAGFAGENVARAGVVTNGSFELDSAQNSFTATSNSPTDLYAWQTLNDTSFTHVVSALQGSPTPAGPSVAENGSYFIQAGPGGEGDLYQHLFGLNPTHAYTLQFYLAASQPTVNDNSVAFFKAGWGATQAIASLNPTYNDTPAESGVGSAWQLVTVNLPTGLSDGFLNFGYRFNTGGGYWYLDNVQLTDSTSVPSVPEPASIGVWLIGTIGALAFGRRKVAARLG